MWCSLTEYEGTVGLWWSYERFINRACNLLYPFCSVCPPLFPLIPVYTPPFIASFPSSPLLSPALTNLDWEARRQAQHDEVTQLGKQGVGDRHQIDDGRHLFCQGQRMGLAQPQLGFKPGDKHMQSTHWAVRQEEITGELHHIWFWLSLWQFCGLISGVSSFGQRYTEDIDHISQ